MLNAFPRLSKTIEVIPDAAELPHVDYQPEFLEKPRLTIAYLGSFHQGKGLHIVLSLAKRIPEHDFVVIGGDANQVHYYFKQSPSNVQFLGFIEQSEIWKQMKDVDVCLLPNQKVVKTGKKSDIGKYTSPLKMFEYMSYSKPMIASDLDVLREVLNEDFAILADPEDLEQWVKAIKKLESRELRKELGSKAFDVFKANYTWEKRASHIYNFINTQLGAK
jgi:glycosyltransferase involved in cell wall biosynthesis